MSRDLRRATVFVTELGGELSAEVAGALERAGPYLRGEVARQMHLKHAPELLFRADTTFADAARIDALLARARADAGHERDGDDDAS